MKTIRELWDETPEGEMIKCPEYNKLVQYIGANFNKIFPDEPNFTGVFWGKLGCWDKTVDEAKIIVVRIIVENEKLNKI